MNKEVIYTDKAPQPIGCYSQAIKVGNTLYVSGQIGFDMEKQMLAATFSEQTRFVFTHLHNIINAVGADFVQVAKVNAYLTDMANFAEFNTIMSEFFTAPYPARAAVAVLTLPKGALVEVECICVL